jgi:peptidylprolyl isomerase
MRRALSALLAGSLLLAACGIGEPTPTPRPACPEAPPTRVEAQAILTDADRAVVRTNKGEFTIELHGEAAPIAAANFVSLARCGFYDQISFHRVLPGFVAQVGDPQTRDNRGDFAGLGTGGPGYQFEIESPDEDLDYDQYSVSMANAGGTATNGSQIFIALADLDDVLDRLYTIFGTVTHGTDVVDEIGEVPINGPRGVPLDPVVIETVSIQTDAPEET